MESHIKQEAVSTAPPQAVRLLQAITRKILYNTRENSC